MRAQAAALRPALEGHCRSGGGPDFSRIGFILSMAAGAEYPSGHRITAIAIAGQPDKSDNSARGFAAGGDPTPKAQCARPGLVRKPSGYLLTATFKPRAFRRQLDPVDERPNYPERNSGGPQ